MAVGFVAGDQVFAFPVQMPLQKQPGIDHFRQVLADKFFRFSHTLGQLQHCAVGVIVQNPTIFFEPAHPVHCTDAADQQSGTCAKPQQAQHHGNPGSAGDNGKDCAGEKAPKTRQQQHAASGDFRNACRQLSFRSAIEHGKGLFRSYCSGGSIHSAGSGVYSTGCAGRCPAHRFTPCVHRPADGAGDGLIKFSIILGIDRLVDDLLDVPAQSIPVLILICHTFHLQKVVPSLYPLSRKNARCLTFSEKKAQKTMPPGNSDGIAS